MHFHKRIAILVLACLLLPVYAQAASSIWEVSKAGHHLYLGGTIHVLSKQDWPLPKSYDRVYRKASKLVFETDLAAMHTPEAGKRMMQALTYRPPKSLQSVLDKATYAEVTQFFKKRGVPMDRLKAFKPGMVSVTMTIMALKRLGQAGEGVDEYYYQRAVHDHKAIGQLETVDQQIHFLADMGKGQENELLRQTMRDIRNLPKIMAQTKQAWRRGEGDRLDRLLIAPMREETPQVYRSLLVERNRAWLPKIEAMLKTPEVEFVMVGAGHLVGDDGLVSQLARQGYRVRQLD